MGRSRPFGYHQEHHEPARPDSEKTPQPPDGNASRLGTIKVWTVACSLAATEAISYLIFLPAGTEMFHFTAFAPRRLWIQRRVPAYDGRRVAPFGDPRITAYLRLPEAYRSLPRPSSPVKAKASTVSPL